MLRGQSILVNRVWYVYKGFCGPVRMAWWLSMQQQQLVPFPFFVFLFLSFSHMDVICHFFGRSSNPRLLTFESCAMVVYLEGDIKKDIVFLSLLFFSLSLYIYMCVCIWWLRNYKKMERKNKRRWSILHLHCPMWRLYPNRRRESELFFRNSISSCCFVGRQLTRRYYRDITTMCLYQV